MSHTATHLRTSANPTDRIIEVLEAQLRIQAARSYYDTCPKENQTAALAALNAALAHAATILPPLT